MSSVASPSPPTTPSPTARRRAQVAKLNRFDRRANSALKYCAIFGAALVFFVMFAVVYSIIANSTDALSRFGLHFLVGSGWDPQADQLGAGPLIYGTLMTSVLSIALATLLGTSIGLFLALMASKRVAGIIGPLVEMLAAVPSVVIGMIGIIVFVPFVHNTIEPVFNALLGWTPFFGPGNTVGNSIFTAALVLTFMVLPIVSSLSRDIFLTVPQELTDGAAALGATRWEVIRGVVIPTTASGVISACVLGFGRALGEAIAVTQVVGGVTVAHLNLFLEGDTVASRLASQFSDPANPLQLSALYYCALILLVFGIVTNATSTWIAHRARV